MFVFDTFSEKNVGEHVQKKQKTGGNEFRLKLPRSSNSMYSFSFFDVLEYTANRLLHGLCSGQEATRQGMAAALTTILTEFPKAIPFPLVRCFKKCFCANYLKLLFF